MRRAHALFACLLSHWITATGRLLGPTTCLPHKDGGILLNALLMETASKLTGKLTVPVVMIKYWLFLLMYRLVSNWYCLFLSEEQMVVR